MYHPIKEIKKFLKYRTFRTIAQVTTLTFILAIAIPNIFINFASAFGQVQSRNIVLSSSVSGATGVTYTVGFTTATAGVIQGVVIDFCSNDPIIGDTCTAPTGFTLGSSTPTVSATLTGLNPSTSSSWTKASQGSAPYSTLFLTDSSASVSVPASTAVSFDITGVTNPTANCTSGSCTFYARILTYSTSAGALGYTPTNPGAVAAPTDAGGVALSTSSQITVTSKVQEILTFCVYTATLDAGNCNAATGTAVTLGNNNGVLSTAGPFVDANTHYDIQTNALHNAVINFYGPTLTSGANTIAADTGVSGTDLTTATSNDQSTSGSPQFGLCTGAVAGSEANLTVAATYSGHAYGSGTYSGTSSPCTTTVTQTAGTATPGGASTAYFGYNITATSATTGDLLATAAPGPFIQGEIAFLGNISNSTVAGIYTTTLTFVATGTY